MANTGAHREQLPPSSSAPCYRRYGRRRWRLGSSTAAAPVLTDEGLVRLQLGYDGDVGADVVMEPDTLDWLIEYLFVTSLEMRGDDGDASPTD
jgi:hypothetical protein